MYLLSPLVTVTKMGEFKFRAKITLNKLINSLNTKKCLC